MTRMGVVGIYSFAGTVGSVTVRVLGGETGKQTGLAVNSWDAVFLLSCFSSLSLTIFSAPVCQSQLEVYGRKERFGKEERKTKEDLRTSLSCFFSSSFSSLSITFCFFTSFCSVISLFS